MHNSTQSLRFVVVLSVLMAANQAVLGADEWYSRGGERYEKRLKLTLQNPLPMERQGEPVVIQMETIRKVAPDFPGKAWVVVDPAAAPESPCGIEANGNDVPSQVDDIDGDGKADELVMLPSLKAKESKTVYIYFTGKEIPQPLYPKKTQIVDFQCADTNTLFAIESDVLAFRFNRTTSGAPGFVGDVLAKNKSFGPAGYSLHLYNQRLPLWGYGNMPFRNYTEQTPVGRCILDPGDVPDQIGIGSILAQQGDGWKMAQAANVMTRAKMLIDGRIRSMGEIETTGWQVGDGIYDVTVRCSMYAGQRWLRYDLTVVAKQGHGGRFALGMMKLENEKGDIQPEAGRLALWGDRIKINVKGVGLAMLFQPGDVKALGEISGGRLLELQNTPAPEKPLRVTIYLSGGCKKEEKPARSAYERWCPDLAEKSCGEFENENEFFNRHGEIAQRVTAPISVAIGRLESNAFQVVKQPFKGGDFFLANPSSKPSVLPGELDLGRHGFNLAGGLKAGAKDTVVDVVNLDGSPRVFIRKTVGPLAVEKISLQAGAKKDEDGIPVEEIKGDEGGVLVSTGKAKWLVTGSGLRKVVINGKELVLEQSQVSGPVKILHNGEVVAVVRVGGDKECTDYYFFKGTDIVQIVANHATGFQSKEARSYVGKKELRVEGCERTDACAWGRWSSDSVFSKVPVLHSAEWCALYSPDRKMGLMCYGSTSAPEIMVEKGGKLDSALANGCQRQELYLTPIEDIEQGEALWPIMSKPFVFITHKDGFACFEDRNGNGVADTIHVTDQNDNGIPDFDGDRWAFDTDSDDGLQMVLEFEVKPRQMKVFCDTVSGSRLHNNVLTAYFGNCPEPLVNTQTPVYAPSKYRHKFDGVLSPAELDQPFFVHECIGDGFFKGPVTEGGFIASGKVTALRGAGHSITFPRHVTLTCLDLDSDGDCDIYVQDSPDMMQNQDKTAWKRWVHYCVFDLSDNNLEPLAVVNPYTGLAYQAQRYFSFLMQDNSKIYQGGYIDNDGVICGGQNWPQAGTWDIDNDGVAEAHIYHECQHTLGMDLAKKRSTKDTWVKGKWNRQRDIYAEKQAIPVNFALLTTWDIQRSWNILPSGTFPLNTYADPHGNSISIYADFLPDKWLGERLDCKAWPDGQWDYWSSNNWNSFIRKKYRFTAAYFFLPGRDNHSEHEGCWNSCFFNPDMRIEIDSDGTPSDGLYRSPFWNGLHYKGMEFGVQFMHDNEDRAKYVAPYYAAVWVPPPGGGNSEKMDEYYIPQQMCNDYSRTTRLKGRMFLYYLDEDRDGYADTYLLDDENDGYFEKRMWCQKDKGILSVFDAGAFGVMAKKLDFTGYPLELKNYEKLVEMYHDSLTRSGLLREVSVKNGKCENTGVAFSAVLGDGWLPRVAVDAVHAGGKDLWKDFSPAGLDTLGRVLSESPLKVEALTSAYSPETLAGIDMLVIGRMDTPLAGNELQALQDYVKGGGILLILVGDETSGGSAALVELAGKFGVKIGNEKGLSLVPGQCKSSEILGETKEAGNTGLLAGVAPFFLEARKAETGEGMKTLLACRGQPLILEKAEGKGRVLVVPSNMFMNRFMCLPRELRKEPFKPGNQALAKNLVKYLLGGVMPRIQIIESSETKAQMQVSGRGGEIRFQIPWKEVLVRLDGKDANVESKDGTVAIRAPQGESRIELTPK